MSTGNLTRHALVLVLFGTSSFWGWAQVPPPQVGEWRVVTDMRNARAIVAHSGGAWVATEGGLYRRGSAGDFEVRTVANGLPSNDLSALARTSPGELLVGSQDGYVAVESPGSASLRIISDIAVSGRVQKGIRSFFVAGDSLLIGSDFGISVYLFPREEFGDTYANFGFAATARVQAITIHHETIWAATSEGIASAWRWSPNLAAPSSWTTYGTAEGLPSKNALSIGILNDTVVVGTATGMAFFDGNAFQALGQAQGAEITSMKTWNASMLLLWNQGGSFSVGRLSSVIGGIELVGSRQGRGTGLSIDDNDGSVWVATSSEGAARWDTGAWETILPNGPVSNLFVSLAVTDQGVLWSGTGANGSGKGFNRFDPSRSAGDQWKSFEFPEYPTMLSNDFYKVSIGSSGSVWVSSWGNGVIEIVADSIRRIINSTTTPKLMGAVPQDPAFVVVGSVALDPDGGQWFVARSAVDGNYVAHLVNDTTFDYHTNGVTPSEGRFTAMVVDQYGTKWLANAEPFNKPGTGLYYFNEQMNVSGTASTNGWGLMTQSDGLPNVTILSLAVDRDGEVWVGTDLGAMIITDPLYPKQRNLRSFPLREQVIQAIAVDGVNNKWIGTKEGIFLVSPDGSQLLTQYTVASTGGKLLSNDVRALAVDQVHGILYIGTEKGLSILGIAPVATERSYSSLEIGPNPFHVPPDQNLTIRNLVPETTIKILSISGSLIAEFRAQGGGRAFWDGKDKNGELVPSGMYIVVAHADDGNQLTTGKIAIIRH